MVFLGCAVAGLISLLGMVFAFGAVGRMLRAPEVARGDAVLGVFALVANGALALLGASIALVSTMSFSRGRQLRRRGRALLAPLENGSAWADLESGAVVPEELRAGLAAQWRENGRTEHASVAAFARLTLDLMALGAPPHLISAAQRDALDEIRHTELCFSLARALDGRSASPAAFPEAARTRTLPRARPLALAQLAVDSLIDGALHEGVSARMVARLAGRCEEARIRAVLKGIAADEGRHAAHGWDVVEWCIAEGGEAVTSALLGAAGALPATMRSELPLAAEGGAWERFGIHGRGLEAEEHRKARASVVRRVRALALASPGPARACLPA
jgi:hypothetical protein